MEYLSYLRFVLNWKLGIFGTVLLLQATQATSDYGGYAGALAAVVCAIMTVFSQIKQKRLEKELEIAKVQHASQKDVTEAWSAFSKQLALEMKDVKARLRLQEAHTRICEKGQMKLVQQLIKAGVDVDLDRLLQDMQEVEMIIMKRANEDIQVDPPPKGKEGSYAPDVAIP